LRLTERNKYDTATCITRLAGLGFIGHRCSFVMDDGAHLDGLASLACCDAEELRSMLYLSADGSNGKFADRLFFGHRVSAYALRIWQPKICPACLKESGYCRRVWDLAAVTTCPVHHRLLMDVCPSCGTCVSWVRNEAARCPAKGCGFYWPDASPRAVADE
jgi:MinD superfamily P-loop ATPase